MITGARLLIISAVLFSGASADEGSSVMFGPARPPSLLALEGLAKSDSIPTLTRPATPGPRKTRSGITGSSKSPRRAFFLSLLVPGAGHLYLRSSRTITSIGLGHLALEALSWGLWASNRSDKNHWTNIFTDFAELNWSATRYLAWRDAVWDHTSATSNYFVVNITPEDSLKLIGTHHYDACCGLDLPERGDQLEIIGKYDQFVYGWRDVIDFEDENRFVAADFLSSPGEAWGESKLEWLTAGVGAKYIQVGPDSLTGSFQVRNMTGTYTSEYSDDINRRSVLRVEYLNMRDSRNMAGKRMQQWVGVMVVNRLISAVVAARMAKKYNEALLSGSSFEMPRTHVQLNMHQSPGGNLTPMLTISHEGLTW